MTTMERDGSVNSYSQRRSRYVPFLGWAYEMWDKYRGMWVIIGWTCRPVK